MGKTALCLNIATHAAVENFGVAIFSLEMSRDQLVQRLITAEGRVDSQRVRQGSLRDSDFTNLARAAGVLQSCPMWIDDTPSITLLEMRSKARRLKAENDIKMVVVDYLQLMRSRSTPRTAGNRRFVAKALARAQSWYAFPALARSEQRGGERSRPSDLRDSGAIEQDADLVLFIHRPEYYDREDEAKKGLAEIMLAKNRNGPTGDVHLRFNREYTRFDSFSQRDGPE
jgi:replicative DNA helicase